MRDLVDTLVTSSSFGVWDVVLAAVVLVVGWLASRWARRSVTAALSRWSGLAPSSTNLIARLVRYAILLLTAGIVLTVLGAPLQPVLAAVVIIGIVAFLALRGISANFGAGLVLQTRRPVHIGDVIAVGDAQGRITEMTGRSVLLRTSDGRTIRVPNTMLLELSLWNISEGGAVRNEVHARIFGSPDLDSLCPAVLRVARAIQRDGGEEPQVLVRTATSGEADVTVRFWSSYEDHETTTSTAVRAVAAILAGHGLPCRVTSVSGQGGPSVSAENG